MSDCNDIGRWMQDAMRLADAPCPHCGAVASEDTGPWPSCNHGKPTATFCLSCDEDSTLEEMGLSDVAVEARSRYAAAAARDAPMRSLFRDTIAGLREIATADPDDTMSLACQTLVTVLQRRLDAGHLPARRSTHGIGGSAVFAEQLRARPPAQG
jgi:hypothetical protein